MWSTTFLTIGLLVLSAKANSFFTQTDEQNIDWWKTSTIYQIYPRSFKDSDGNGVGDLNGITSKLEHIRDAGIEALWLSPIYKSPQKDYGYDISNFTDITPEFGTLADFDKLIAKAKTLGLKVLLDFVPNHSSDEHDWFKKSIKKVKPYDEYYIWKDAKIGSSGERLPPNNWLSVFGGSAWEWNEERGQYYYHVFVSGQPDLNYRSKKLDQEMKDVFTFWMKRGVDGFRVDAINYMFEDIKLQDNPKSGKDVPTDEFEYLDPIYTRDLDETYGIVGSWRKLIDDFVKEHKTDGKPLLMEAYASFQKTIQYYDVGVNPFNFMFMSDLNAKSKATDFRKVISKWLKAVPKNDVSNWVVGNHDNHRVATRFGEKREDQISMLSAVLPGILVVYNGDEIGMVDRHFSWDETVDPAGCNTDPDRYEQKSRDPERTPFQWDATTSAGFSTTEKTWLPVNENYKTLNLAAQKKAEVSHYKVFQALTKLKKSPVLQKGKVQLLLVTDKILAVIRRLAGQRTVVLLINFNDEAVEVDAKTWLNIPQQMEIYIASVKSELTAGRKVDTTKLSIPGAASIILY